MATCRPSAGSGERQRARRPRRRSDRTGRRSTRSIDAPARSARRASSVCRCGRNGIRPRSIRGPSSSSTAGSTVTEPATAQAMTAIVPLAIPLKTSEPIDVHAGHRDRDGGARTITTVRPEVRAVRSSASCDGQPALALLARADDVEERVVDADRHPDQQHDGLDAVVEREHLADRSEQPERRRRPRSLRAATGTSAATSGAEREQQHEQRHRDREQLGAAQVVAAAALSAGDRGRHGRVRRLRPPSTDACSARDRK